MNEYQSLADELAAREQADEDAWTVTADYERAAEAVNDNARRAGAIRARATTGEALKHGADPREVWLDLLIQGADDGWSGRSNDARRSYFDGVREEIRDMRMQLRRIR